MRRHHAPHRSSLTAHRAALHRDRPSPAGLCACRKRRARKPWRSCSRSFPRFRWKAPSHRKCRRAARRRRKFHTARSGTDRRIPASRPIPSRGRPRRRKRPRSGCRHKRRAPAFPRVWGSPAAGTAKRSARRSARRRRRAPAQARDSAASSQVIKALVS